VPQQCGRPGEGRCGHCARHEVDRDAGAVVSEHDPNGKAPGEPGSKLDAGKAPLRRGALEYFPRALMAVAEVSAFGASKYAWNGWETVPDGVSRYGDAGARHVVKERIEGPYD